MLHTGMVLTDMQHKIGLVLPWTTKIC